MNEHEEFLEALEQAWDDVEFIPEMIVPIEVVTGQDAYGGSVEIS